MLRVSVVTPSFNQARFLGATLASVAGQGPRLLEHIVMDGGSTDGSRELLERSTGVRWVSERDQGQSDAVNKGLALARGDIIGWINSDDVYCPGSFERAAARLEADDTLAGVFGHCDIIDEHGVVGGRVDALPVDLEVMLGFGTIPQPACFVRRSWFERVGGVDASFRYAMDYDFWLRTMLRGARYAAVDEVWSQFRVHGASKTGSEGDRFFPEVERAMEAALASPDLPPSLAARRGAVRRRFFTNLAWGAYGNLQLTQARRLTWRALQADPTGLDRAWWQGALKSALPLSAVKMARQAREQWRASRTGACERT